MYLGMLILYISKTLTYEFWYGMIMLNQYQDKISRQSKTMLHDTDSFTIHIKTENFYEDIANNVEKWFDTSNYDGDDKSSLPIRKDKKR